ncbi:MAG: hypothetical protein ABJB74_11350 [Gemmatimonas sp.]
MLTALTRHAALKVLMLRAIVLFLLVTLVVSALRIDSPVGVVLLLAALGWVDLQRRHESLFWSNLGYSAWQTIGVVVSVGVVAETLFSILVQPWIALLLRRGT